MRRLFSLCNDWTPQKNCSCAVPTGLRNTFVETDFPTLKRGADIHCAYGALAGLSGLANAAPAARLPER